MRENTQNRSTYRVKYDDWICLLCQNHNYSFRSICNRCRLQTKQENARLTELYQQQLGLAQAQWDLQIGEPELLFPKVVLLLISSEPWEQAAKREGNDCPNVKWINNLIEE